MHKAHIPSLQLPAVQLGVMLTFLAGLLTSLLLLPHLSVGLDQVRWGRRVMGERVTREKSDQRKE